MNKISSYAIILPSFSMQLHMRGSLTWKTAMINKAVQKTNCKIVATESNRAATNLTENKNYVAGKNLKIWVDIQGKAEAGDTKENNQKARKNLIGKILFSAIAGIISMQLHMRGSLTEWQQS